MFDVCFSSAGALAGLLRDGALSAREVTRAHLDRIELVNPAVNAVVTLVADQALAQADAADQRHAAGAELPVLHGLPILHKDTHATAGIRTTMGSPILADNVPAADELIIARLRAAGTIALGKTNVPEFAAGSHTFNPLFGITRNPYDLTRTAGGSSGGAAVALATGMCPIAEGSDFGGSLRNPAAFCNVVGLRPSIGRVPTHPDPFPWHNLGVGGPMARSVDDVALLLSVIAGPDPRVPVSLSEPGSAFAQVHLPDPRGLRIAVGAGFGGALPIEPEIVGAIEAAGRVFEGLGAHVEPAMPDLRGAAEAFDIRRAWLFDANLGPVLDACGDRVGDLVKATIRGNVEQGRALRTADLARSERLLAALYERTAEFFDSYDALLVPTTQVLPFDVHTEYPTRIGDHQLSSYLDWMRSCCDITTTGAPAISVPAGFSRDGLPIGLQIVGRHRGEAALLGIAKLFEQATRYGEARPPTGSVNRSPSARPPRQH
jgi:amidase